MTNASLRFLLFAVCMGVLTSLASVMTSHAESIGVRHNVPLWIDKAQVTGAADEQARVEIAVFLGFKDEAGLKNLIAELSTPSSVHYGEFLTPEQFHQRFSPDAKNVAKVQKMLSGFGLTIESSPASGLYVRASGTVKQIKAAFGVSQNLYAYKGKVLRANSETPRLSNEMAGIVTFIAGLDDTKLLRKPDNIRLTDDSRPVAMAAVVADGKVSPAAPPPPQDGIPDAFCSKYFGDKHAELSTTPKPYARVIPYDVCGYTPQQLRQAYGIDVAYETGVGVKVGIVDVYGSPTIERDTNRYSYNHGLPQINHNNFLQILPPGITNVPASDPCGPQGWYGEETLDVQSVHSLAPHAFIVYEGDTCTDPVNGALYDMIDNHRSDIVTNSYSYGGEALPADFLNSENEFFMQAAAQGMSILFSSGDDGDQAAGNGIASGSWDATSPYVTAVGGTSLALYDTSGNKKEWAWGNYRASLADATVSTDGGYITTSGLASAFTFYAGSGGGPSLAMLAPDYQANVSYTLSGYTTLEDGEVVPLEAPHRVTPDISMVGDPYTGFLYGESYTITGDPVLDSGCVPTSATVEYCEEDIGGTSLSSPLFAGVLALVNQSRLEHHKKPVGFVNPALYGMTVGAPGDRTSPIVDVQAPTTPTAVLRTYLGSPTKARVVTINSGPSTTDPTKIIEGLDTSYLTTPGYDEATGLGTPYVPALIKAFDLYSH